VTGAGPAQCASIRPFCMAGGRRPHSKRARPSWLICAPRVLTRRPTLCARVDAVGAARHRRRSTLALTACPRAVRQLDRGTVSSVLEPHDRRHISHERTLSRRLRRLFRHTGSRHDPDSRAPGQPVALHVPSDVREHLVCGPGEQSAKVGHDPILDHTKRSRPPVQLCDAPSIDPAPRRLRAPADSPRPRSGNVMAGFRAGISGRTASRRAQAGRSRSDAHRNRASGAGSMHRARPDRPPGAAGSWSA
jgi:hypothetical protein